MLRPYTAHGAPRLALPPRLHLLHEAPGETAEIHRNDGGILLQGLDPVQVDRRFLVRAVERQRGPISVRGLGGVARVLEGDSEIVVERGHGRVDLDRTGERSERLLEPGLTDVYPRQVVHRPQVAPVEDDRALERRDGPRGIAQLVPDAAEQAVA